MKLGGLFSGIGGLEFAWLRNGGTVAWMCEIDPSARKVLEARFPGVPIYPDVAELDPSEVEPVDVLTGGSPCQGFSIAGGRKGLEHVESRLFADYIRILDGLSERGLKWAVWENVPGVLSISNDNGERTFPHVVAALVGADEPVRLNRNVRWNTGLAARGQRAVSWRVLDSRHFGVPQRRRRVYACVAVGGACERRAFGALLALPEGVQGDTAACSQTGQGTAGAAARGVAIRGRDRGDGWGSELEVADDETAFALRTGGGGQSKPHVFVPDVAHTLRGEGHDASEDGTGRGTPIVPQSFNWQSGGGARGLDPRPDVSALTTQQTPAVLMTMREGKDGGGKGPLLSEDESLTLATGNGQVLFEPYGFATSSLDWPQQGSAPPVKANRNGQDTGSGASVLAYGVRRLTPVECERLQGFPDGWTEPAGSDSARYRALGNAVTVNVPEWLFGRMLALEDQAEAAA